MIKRWIYADPHYWHGNVIMYSGRPFIDAIQMNKVLIKNHNEVVRADDKVFILGDFCLANKDKTKEIVFKLNGKLILIMGNHDRGRNIQWWYDVGFNEVIKYPIIVNGNVILSHEPVKDIVEPFYNIHGHMHEKDLFEGRYWNASVERTNYSPLDLDLLLRGLIMCHF